MLRFFHRIRLVPLLLALGLVVVCPAPGFGADTFTPGSVFWAPGDCSGACEVFDVALDDLSHPSATAFARNLSAVINFAKFREERLATYQEFTTHTDQLLELKQHLEEDNADLEVTFGLVAQRAVAAFHLEPTGRRWRRH